jgi:hypothetical protein
MPNMDVVSPDPAGFALDRQCFEEAAVDKFIDQVRLIPEPANELSPVDVTASISRQGEPEFQIFHFQNGDMISTDGTTEQAVEVALWVRSLLPDDPGVRIGLVDEGYTGHVDLDPGMSEDDIKSGWEEHDEYSPERARFLSEAGCRQKEA